MYGGGADTVALVGEQDLSQGQNLWLGFGHFVSEIVEA